MFTDIQMVNTLKVSVSVLSFSNGKKALSER